LQERYNLLNAVRGRQKFSRLRFDSAKARAKLQGVLARMNEEPSLCSQLLNEPISDLSSHYPSVSSPEDVDFIGGTILGAKGAWLFFAGPSGQHYGVNMSEKIGRFLSEENAQNLFGAIN